MKQLCMALFAVALVGSVSLFAQEPAPVAGADAVPAAQKHCCAGGAAAAQCAPGHGDFMMKRLTKELDLTTQQQERVQAIIAAAKDWAVQHRPEMQDQFKALVEQFKQEKMDDAALDAIHQKAEQARENARIFLRQTLKQVHDVLTPEQRAKAADKLGMLIGRIMPGGMMGGMHGGMTGPGVKMPPPPDAK